MSDLKSQFCEACQADAPKVTDEELAEFMKQLPDWAVISEQVSEHHVLQLKRVFKFKNFKAAWEFGEKLMHLAESEGHHPGIFVEWGKVTVTWWSHSIKGLHKNDFIMAVKTDELFQ
ncbi:4a-hydroxytetrahydrobiopterin dehydratase [Moraxella sp. Tifton1]|uniref:4a-hydroxytetrahydrobiopterin dehydratase n=1 Tax=Moraxella oculi TaxID=2940516 RepID=UPI0020113446|nr:4a-hydroxytetrahydrobiopterin dehydratase [Moraxella sp. Tifton1]MCL1623746.1 4a-hydroxytetrahydrobiopterin dehydratase [Moraxella sp. Tifton1]